MQILKVAMSPSHVQKAESRICGTRAYKNAQYIKHIASHLIQDSKQGITGIIPFETLNKLHTTPNPAGVIENKELAILLEKNKLPLLNATVSDPLFNGTLYFVQITFNIPGGASSISNNDIQTALNYSKRAVIPISAYASQYGSNSLKVSNDIIQYSVTLTSNTYNNGNVQAWVNNILNDNNLPTGSSCIIILNPLGMTNTDADRAKGIGGIHGYAAHTPFCFCNVYGQNFTISDEQDLYAEILSHEIAEMTVDPLANIVNPEVCDACAGNCGNDWLDYFDNHDQFIVGPDFSRYVYFISSIIRPASYDPNTNCAKPGSDTHAVCVYAPPTPRVMIADFSSGKPPLQVKYLENWGQSNVLNGWTDPGDLQLAGDFMGLKHDQILFINVNPQGGRVMIADFSSGKPPLQVKYWENWGEEKILDGWIDKFINLAGNFTALGDDQLFLLTQ